MEKLDLFRCNVCGNVVEILFVGNGELVCCGEPMEKLVPQTNEEAIFEKHVPIISEADDNNYEIRVGEILHPMLEEHYITFIQAISEDRNCTQLKFLYPNTEPKMYLNKDFSYGYSREYCNIHGLWKS